MPAAELMPPRGCEDGIVPGLSPWLVRGLLILSLYIISSLWVYFCVQVSPLCEDPSYDQALIQLAGRRLSSSKVPRAT